MLFRSDTVASSWVAGAIVSFTYDGTSWVMNTGVDSNDMRTAATQAPADVSNTNSIGSSEEYARADHVHAISVTSGTNDGEITIGNTTIKPKGINSAAYKVVDLSSSSITSSSTDSTVPTSKLVYNYVTSAISNSFAANDAMRFKGTIAGGETGLYGALTSAANAGDTYKVSASGKINGIAVEVGDMLICTTDNTSSANANNYTTIAANWTIIQTNIDGAVTGPLSATNGSIALFDTNGRVIKAYGSTDNVGSTTQPIYLNSGGIPTASSTYAGGTKVTLNGTAKGGNTASFYAPTSAGTSGQLLASTAGTPAWKTVSIVATDDTSGNVITDISIGTGTAPAFTPGTTAYAEVTANGTLTIRNQTASTFTPGSYPSLTTTKANLNISLS